MEKQRPDYVLYGYAVGAFIVASAAYYAAKHETLTKIIPSPDKDADQQQAASGTATTGASSTSAQSSSGPAPVTIDETVGGTTIDQDAISYIFPSGSAAQTQAPQQSYMPMFAFAYTTGAQQFTNEYIEQSDAETLAALQSLEQESLQAEAQQQATALAMQKAQLAEQSSYLKQNTPKPVKHKHGKGLF